MNKELQLIGVVGAGAMGLGIAQVCATAGCQVLMFDLSAAALERAVKAIDADLSSGVARGKLSEADARAIVGRVEVVTDLKSLASCDLVVEAVVEKLEVKQQLLRGLEEIVSDECVLATNTSSLSVTAIASVCAHPHRVAGWHFFNPVQRMRIVEVIQAQRTSANVTSKLVNLSKRIGHRCVVASDSPGFVVNHAGRAFVTEGLKMLAERTADHATLDNILRSCAGFRMGPFELLDLTGLDVSVPVMEAIHAQYYGDDRYRPVALARTRLEAGLLGRKSGRGFYQYESGKAFMEEHATTSSSEVETPRVWWPVDGPGCLPEKVTSILGNVTRELTSESAELILLAPTHKDLSSTLQDMPLDATRVMAIDPYFSGNSGVTLMASPATSSKTIVVAKSLFMWMSVPAFVVADSPGYVAPRTVACIVNLACEIAQQGIATPADIDAAVRLALGYPAGPFEWGTRLGLKNVVGILNCLYSTFRDQRYRPSSWLVRRAQLGLELATPDLAQ